MREEGNTEGKANCFVRLSSSSEARLNDQVRRHFTRGVSPPLCRVYFAPRWWWQCCLSSCTLKRGLKETGYELHVVWDMQSSWSCFSGQLRTFVSIRSNKDLMLGKKYKWNLMLLREHEMQKILVKARMSLEGTWLNYLGLKLAFCFFLLIKIPVQLLLILSLTFVCFVNVTLQFTSSAFFQIEQLWFPLMHIRAGLVSF